MPRARERGCWGCMAMEVMVEETHWPEPSANPGFKGVLGRGCVTRLPPPLKNNSATPVLHCTASVTSEENTLPKVQTSHRRSIVWRTPPGTQRFLAHHCSPPRDPLILPWQLTSTRCLGRSSLPRSPPALQSLVSPSGKTVARAHAAVPSFASTKVSGGQLAKQQPFHRHRLCRQAPTRVSRFGETAPAAAAAARETALKINRRGVSAVGPALCQTRMSGSAQSLGLALATSHRHRRRRQPHLRHPTRAPTATSPRR